MSQFDDAPRTDPALVEGITKTPRPVNKYVEFGARVPTVFVLKYNGRKSRVFQAVYPDFRAFWIRNDNKQVFLDQETVDKIFKEVT